MTNAADTPDDTQSNPAPAPLTAQGESELMAGWGGARQPIVSILCATFNHAPFIRAALDGFLAQKTDFPFEVIVRDDASTDGTTGIVREYAARYPNVVRPIIEPVNTYSQGVSPFLPLCGAAHGEFIANCEGDDYWIDPTKLQRQVEVLRSAQHVAFCFHDVIAVRDGRATGEWALPPDLPRVIPPRSLELPEGWFPMPVTWVYRRSACVHDAEEFGKIVNKDNLVLSQVAAHGSGVYLRGAAAVYRLHGGSVYGTKSEQVQRITRLNSLLWISHYHFRMGCPRAGRKFAHAAASLAALELKSYGRTVYASTLSMLLRLLVTDAMDTVDRGKFLRRSYAAIRRRI